ncbi:MAG: hypothetical protein ABIP93_02485 [Gemmatimonadaceae bacterium]
MNDPAMDPERLAALLDGRLAAADRQRLMEKLAVSDESLAAYADAAAVLGELEREGVIAARATEADGAAPAPSVVPPGVTTTPAEQRATVTPIAEARARSRPVSRMPLMRWAALAAAVVIMIAGPVLWRRSRPDGGIDLASGAVSYAALLAPDVRAAGLPVGWDATPWGTTRGASDPLTPEARAVRVGSRVTDLELAAGARDTAATRAIANEVAALLEEVPGAGAVSSTYRSFAGAAADTEALSRARRDAALVAGQDDLALGLWLEAARVAAARRDSAYFGRPESRASLARARGSRAVQSLAPASMSTLDAALAATRDIVWASVERELTALLAALGG